MVEKHHILTLEPVFWVFFSAKTLAKKLLYTVYDRVGHSKQQQFQNAIVQTLESEICSPKDAVCNISELSLSMKKYESLVRYTNRKLIQYQEKIGVRIPSLSRGCKVVDSAWQNILLASGGFDAPLCDPGEGFVVIFWDFTKWLGYVAHEECLWSTVDTSFQYSFLIRRDGSPCGGG